MCRMQPAISPTVLVNRGFRAVDGKQSRLKEVLASDPAEIADSVHPAGQYWTILLFCC